MNSKIIIILIIITLIVSSVIILIVKKDSETGSFYIIEKSSGKMSVENSNETLVLKQTDTMDIYFILNLRNPGKNHEYRLTVFLENGAFEKILQSNIIAIKKEAPQSAEISFAKRDNTYEKGLYKVSLFYNDSLLKSQNFEIK